MRLYDATRIISEELYRYPGDSVVAFSMEEMDGVSVSEIRMGSHTGTHIDAPRHYLPGGAPIEQIPPDACIGSCLLKQVPPGRIQAGIGGELPPGVYRLVIHSGWSFDRPDEYGYLTPDDARTLVELGVVAVGTDAPSIEAPDGDGEVHRILLAAGVLIIELLQLEGIPEGMYTMIALPLPFRGIDGSPARVIFQDLECVIP